MHGQEHLAAAPSDTSQGTEPQGSIPKATSQAEALLSTLQSSQTDSKPGINSFFTRWKG